MLHVDVLSIVAPRLSSSKPEPASSHSALPPLGCWGPGHTCRPVVSRQGLEPSSQSHCGGEGGGEQASQQARLRGSQGLLHSDL